MIVTIDEIFAQVSVPNAQNISFVVGWIKDNEFHLLETFQHNEYLKTLFPEEWQEIKNEEDQFEQEMQEHGDQCAENDEHPCWHNWDSGFITDKYRKLAGKHNMIRFGILVYHDKRSSKRGYENIVELYAQEAAYAPNEKAIEELAGLGFKMNRVKYYD